MLQPTKVLPILACIFILASGETCCPNIESILERHFSDLSARISQLEAQVSSLENTVLSNIDNNEDGDNAVTDCQDVRSERQDATIESGLYMVQTPNLKRSIYCNFTGDETWTTISRRINEEDIFNRTWEEYKNGFGSASGDYWIGNEMLSQLTEKHEYSLRIIMGGGLIGKKVSMYHTIRVMPESTDYYLLVGDYDSENSNGGDSLFPDAPCNVGAKKNAPFSTFDRGEAQNCSVTLSGGWWFTGCGCSNLNGKYVRGGSVPTNGPNIGLYWDNLYVDRWGLKSSLRTAMMQIKRI